MTYISYENKVPKTLYKSVKFVRDNKYIQNRFY